jgi:hypothetical protein
MVASEAAAARVNIGHNKKGKSIMKAKVQAVRCCAAFVLGTVAIGTTPVTAAPFDEARSSNWGVNVRNTIGSPVAELRNGPSARVIQTGNLTEPPYGDGSLGIYVANNSTTLAPPAEKVDFGNEVDFFGDPVLALNKVGFHVFQTGENIGYGGPSNLPVIRFEIDANLNTLPADNYTTMVWNPGPLATVNEWSAFIDATTNGTWTFTGAEAAATGCAAGCTFVAAMNALNDGGAPPTVYTVSVGKGRDNMWIGAVDGLRLNNTIYDFEEDGVRSRRIGGHGHGHHDDDDNGHHHDNDDDDDN